MEFRSLKAIAREIPRRNRKRLQEKLLGLILDSDRVGLIPVDLAKNILRLYQDGRLSSSLGLELTLEGALIIEREKSLKLFSENEALSKSVGKLKNLIGED